MRMRHLVPLALAIAASAPAQLPISGLGNGPGSDNAVMRRWQGNTDRPDRALDRYRRAELAGQIHALDRRIDRLRDSGQITRAEARQLRREQARLVHAYYHFSAGGFSDSEAAELQNRLLAANSLARPVPPPAGGR